MTSSKRILVAHQPAIRAALESLQLRYGLASLSEAWRLSIHISSNPVPLTVQCMSDFQVLESGDMPGRFLLQLSKSNLRLLAALQGRFELESQSQALRFAAFRAGELVRSGRGKVLARRERSG